MSVSFLIKLDMIQSDLTKQINLLQTDGQIKQKIKCLWRVTVQCIGLSGVLGSVVLKPRRYRYKDTRSQLELKKNIEAYLSCQEKMSKVEKKNTLTHCHLFPKTVTF